MRGKITPTSTEINSKALLKTPKTKLALADPISLSSESFLVELSFELVSVETGIEPSSFLNTSFVPSR